MEPIIYSLWYPFNQSCWDGQSFGVLSLFPRIHVPELDHVVHKGIVLLPWEEVVLAAEMEYWNCVAQEAKKNKAARSSNEGAAGSFLRRERQASVSPSRSWIGRRLFLG